LAINDRIEYKQKELTGSIIQLIESDLVQKGDYPLKLTKKGKLLSIQYAFKRLIQNRLGS
jgi:hypothetical protein